MDFADGYPMDGYPMDGHGMDGYRPAGPNTIIGVCGGSGSGKTTLARRMVDALGPGSATHLSFDAYYRDLGHLPLDERARMNFDHPDSLDAGLLGEHLASLKAGFEVAVPVYDFATYARTGDLDLVAPHRYVIVEGVLLFAFPELRQQLDIAIFRHVGEDIRAGRRFQRDVATRGRTEASVRHQWEATVQPMYEVHVEPYAHLADLVTTADEPLDLAVARITAAVRARGAHAPEPTPLPAA